MSSLEHRSTSPRRTFLQKLGALSALVAAGGSGVEAQPAAAQGGATDPWLAGLTGKHKQVFDAPEPNSGFPMIFAYTYMGTMTSTYKLAPGEVTAVVVLRHFAMPMALSDAVWAKYKIGAMINVQDPATKAPALRNIFYKSKAGDMMLPDASIDKLIASKGIFLACGVALSVLSEKAAAGAGVTAAVAKKEWEAGILPGIHVAPSGVLAVGRAQERGCSYCFAG